ncbi:hypothetical protein KC333_g7048 [Hortaea werneckii]|nr:hypothetical protein KC333_g7048 [Hortaea werneckii]KAI7309587.1 hypothetical protein KC326_g6993 [Hortaea werneckii]
MAAAAATATTGTAATAASAADGLSIARVYKDAVNRLRSHVQQAPPPPPPQQPVAFQPQFAPMATFVESRFQHNFNQMGQTPLQADSGPSQVQQPQFNQLQSPAAPQSGGGLFGTQQPQFNQPQGFAAAQYDGGPFQVQQPQYNQPQSFTAPRLMAPPIPAPQQSFPPAEGRSPSASHGNWNPLLGEGALPRNQSPPVKLEPDDENNGANQSPPIKSEPDNESNGASRSIWSSAESVAEGRAIANTRHHAVEDTNELQRAQSDLNLLAMPSQLGFGGG